MRAVSPYLTPPKRSRAALEWLLLLLVALVAAGVVTLNLRGDAAQVNGGARVLAQDLLFARSEAVRLGASVSFWLEPDAYSVFTSTPGQGEVTLLRREFGRSYPLVHVGGSAAFRFDSRGLADGGAILLSSVQDDAFARCVQLGTDGRISLEAACPPGSGQPVMAHSW